MTTQLATGSPIWAQGLFTGALQPLAGDPRVCVVPDAPSTADAGRQFTTGAAAYDQRYGHSEHFLKLFRQALEACPNPVPRDPVILDVGTGSGVNSVLPLLEIFDGPRIVATDLSPDLLSLLAARLAAMDAPPRVLPVLMDAMSDPVAAEAFDLVTGAAILHHLVEPERCLSMAAKALRPGGTAIFFEPFDGHGLVRLAYQRILAEADRHALDPAVAEVLTRMIVDTAARTRPDRASVAWQALEDKWLFSRDQLERWAARTGFAGVTFVANNVNPNLFRNYAAVQLRLATGRDDLAMPDWAVAILDEFDAAITPDGKRAMMIAGAILLTKGGA